MYPLLSPSTSELGDIKNQIAQLFQDYKDLHVCLDHNTVDFGGVKFELHPQTVA